MSSALTTAIAGGVLSAGSVSAFFAWLLKRNLAKVSVKQGEATLASQIGSSASGWIEQQDRRVSELQRDLESARAETASVRADSAREVQQLREEVGRLSQELNAFRLGIAAPLGYVIVPRVVWEQARRRDKQRGELPATSFPGEDIENVVRDIKDPPEGGGV